MTGSLKVTSQLGDSASALLLSDLGAAVPNESCPRDSRDELQLHELCVEMSSYYLFKLCAGLPLYRSEIYTRLVYASPKNSVCIHVSLLNFQQKKSQLGFGKSHVPVLSSK